MELLVNPANYDNAIELIKLGVSQIYVGISHHSIHMNAILSLVELKTLLRYKQNTKILISINRFFFEPDLDPLQTLLTDLKALNIDGIIFSDFAVIQIAKEINLQTNFIYRPNTLVTNYGQFDFYLKNNIHSVVLANELNKKEVWDIAKNKNQMQIYMQISGHVLMMESR
jgi:collagenase-like PrtC family protease